MPSLTLNQDNLGVGLPVALQLSVTLRLSSSRTMMLRGILSKTGETRSRNIQQLLTEKLKQSVIYVSVQKAFPN